MADLDPDKLFENWNHYLCVAPERDLPSVCYHYTTAAGLFGLLTSKSLYATDKRFLNDRTEVQHGVDTAVDALKSAAGKSEKSQSSTLFNETCDYVLAEREERHFIFSLSERSDDLSQWRGYANDGNGFTIGFESDYFRRASNGPNGPYAFNRVSYSVQQFKALIATISDQYVSAFAAQPDVHNVASCFSATVGTAACFYKHNSFRFEREWRLVSYVYPSGPEEVLVRNSGERLIPYINLPLCEDDKKLPIVEIGIGPSVKNPNTRAVIEDLCRKANIEPKIYQANTPYVRY